MRRTVAIALLAIGCGLTAFGLFTAGEAFGDAPLAITADGTGGHALPTADQLHDPLANPVAAWDDVKAAKSLGWGVAVLASLVLLARLLGRLGGVFKRLGEGKVALVIGAVGAFAVTAYNALALNGTWFAAAMSAVVAVAGYWDASAPKKADA